jgi:hypothetical protein
MELVSYFHVAWCEHHATKNHFFVVLISYLINDINKALLLTSEEEKIPT